MYQILGHHHVSMLTKDAQQNNHFYQKVLGLRRVKVTVNQDDPSMYHLFYGDQTGSPGTELSFFELPRSGRTYRGTNAITKIGLLVPTEKSLSYWEAQFEKYGIPHGEITAYAERSALSFEDPDGLRIALVVDPHPKMTHWKAWEKSTVPVEHQIQGIGPIEITVRRPEKLAKTLTEVFGYKEVFHSENGRTFQAVQGEAFGEIILKLSEEPVEKPGRGSIHHLAIRAKNEKELIYWEEQIKQRGFHSTGIIDRYYFKSIYFRESNGILFEVATDGPGFTIDGKVETLGEKLDLPPFLEKRRMEIESNLKKIDKEN